ncbi:MAG: flagellar type III secretion system protein FlhB [Methylocystis sp.]|nr:flagellar type III secretion system protein FlhB [Methylocystis sp.]
MADAEDHESRTEQATEKKVLDTVEQGKLPVSRDAAVAALFASFLLSLSFVIETVGPRFATALGLIIGNAGELAVHNGADAFLYSQIILLEGARFLTPMLALFVIAGIAASFVQGAPRFVFDRIQPDLSRISIREGWRRMFGLPGLIELLKALFKIAIIGGATVFSLTVDRGLLTDAMRVEPNFVPSVAIKLTIHMTSVVCIATALLALADLVWAQLKWRRDMRMSRQEIKDELKQAEGDPLVKGRLRSLALDRSRKRMMAAVPKATLVITNPTHFAIALRYVREDGGAPLVVAKGQDLIALKIREVAENHGIPVIEKKALVRAMFDHVEVDKMIPPEFYRPIAELIHFLHSNHARFAAANRP